MNSEKNKIATSALIRAFHILMVNDKDICELLNIEQTDSLEFTVIDFSTSKRAMLLLNMVVDLMNMIGDNNTLAIQWFNTENKHLMGVPRKLIETNEGLDKVVNYLSMIHHQQTH